MTTTAEDAKRDTRTPMKDRKERKPREWVVLTGSDVDWHVAGTVKAHSRKAAITSVITTNEKADQGAGPAPRRAYVAVSAEDWQPITPKIEQPPPVITWETAK